MSVHALHKTAANWRQHHPLSRMPSMGAGNWIMGNRSQDIEQRQGKPQLDNVEAGQPRFDIESSPLRAVDMGDLGS